MQRVLATAEEGALLSCARLARSIHHHVTRVVFYTIVLRRREGGAGDECTVPLSLDSREGCGSRNSLHPLPSPFLPSFLPYVWSPSLTQLIFYAPHAAHVKPRQAASPPPVPRLARAVRAHSRVVQDGTSEPRGKEDLRGENTPPAPLKPTSLAFLHLRVHFALVTFLNIRHAYEIA